MPYRDHWKIKALQVFVRFFCLEIFEIIDEFAGVLIHGILRGEEKVRSAKLCANYKRIKQKSLTSFHAKL